MHRRVLSTQIAVLSCGIFAFLNLYATQPLLPLLGTLFHADKVQLGMTISAVTVGVALSAPLFGSVTERSDRKQVIMASLGALAVFTLMVSLSPSLNWLIFWRFTQGIALPGVFTSVITYINEECEPDQVGSMMRIYVSGTVLGGFLGRLVTGQTAHAMVWQSGFYLLAGLNLLGALVVWIFLPKGQRVLPEAQANRPGLSHHARVMAVHLTNARLLPLCLLGFAILFCLVAEFTYITYHLSGAPFFLSTGQLSWLFAVYLVGFVATPLSSLLLNRRDARFTFCTALVLSQAGVLLTLLPNLGAVIVGLMMCSTGVFIAQAAALSSLRHMVEESMRVSAAGVYLSFYYLGGTVAGVLPGYVWRLGGWPATVATIVLVEMSALVLAWHSLKTPAVTVAPLLRGEIVEGMVD